MHVSSLRGRREGNAGTSANRVPMVTSERQRADAPAAPREGLGTLTGVCFGLLLLGMVGAFTLLLNLASPWIAWGYVGVSLAVGLPGGIAGASRRRRHL